ncbi:hypothetical protein NG800_018815 [Epilithonimonas ginsengisoli]|uniref:VCBS repeat-containing protein n=1 Tax=Epilithonimonas ginsengisoli TaxID=1245592 RepID=A0ABU4JN66_9FLAO|nr:MULTISPECIES: hypothetical protein [Chryseobacterium group]MBV6881924.1 hypothetical protein [Epilithonimonas sp. FP105]MDW8550983.1 hypothetical protein [Epilithonimonas ginsengisoli]OAH69412.1 hypothetical protein AXA65_14630 [Chryseobacterium sp. FP211-J200]
MKHFFSFFAIIFFSALQSQELKDFTIPKGYKKILETKGDLDKDGKDETVLVFNTDKTPDSESPGLVRKFYILKNVNGKLKIWKENSNLIFDSKEGFYPESNELELNIKNNYLVIFQSYFSNSRHTVTSKNTYRFQNGDFYLIGALVKFDDTCEFNFSDEINFSTGKVIVDEQYSECDSGYERKVPKNYYKEFTHKLPKLIKMNEYKMGKNEIKIPNSKKSFNF